MKPRMPQKACDHCYSGKKRCLMRPASSICVRCEKLSLSCTVSRQQPRAGRPPKLGLPGVAKGSLGVWDPALIEGSPVEEGTGGKGRFGSQLVPGGGGLRDGEGPSTPVPRYSSKSPIPELEGFYLLNDIYMIGSTFAKDFHRALEYCHHHSSDLLDEIFLALGSCLSWARFGLITADQVDVGSGAVSVGKLRNVVISHSHDALAVLMLGQALAAFNSLVISTGTISILRFSLSLAHPWYAEIARNQFLEPIVIAPVFWDTVWCLLHREVPVIRPLFNRAGVIDRVAGRCTSLLPILYDLCVVSHQLKDGSTQEDALRGVEDQIRGWQPNDSGLDSEEYSELEILSMRTQATMYRTASLLLIHRLRQPLASEDTTATVLAGDILEARRQFFVDAGPDAKLQNASFPVFLAVLEIPISAEDLWRSSTWLHTRPACADRMISFSKYLWDQRRSGFNGSLFDLIETAPELVPVP